MALFLISSAAQPASGAEPPVDVAVVVVAPAQHTVAVAGGQGNGQPLDGEPAAGAFRGENRQ